MARYRPQTGQTQRANLLMWGVKITCKSDTERSFRAVSSGSNIIYLQRIPPFSYFVQFFIPKLFHLEMTYCLLHRAAAAFLAIMRRFLGDKLSARAMPPLDAPSLDSATAAGFFLRS